MRALIEGLFVNGFAETPVDGIGLAAMDDGAALRVGDRWLVVTTDSHVVHPIFFPGGDIGRLAVAGTVNDLAMMGATEVLALTCAVILEEGFAALGPRAHPGVHPTSTCREAGAVIVTGDTKVMGRGELDGIVLNTTGIGLTERVVPDSGLRPATASSSPAPSGTTASPSWRCARGSSSRAISAPTWPRSTISSRARLPPASGAVTAMKDPTRGGLVERAPRDGRQERCRHRSRRDGPCPCRRSCGAAAELLGIDPLHVANEGKAVLGVRPEAADRVLAALAVAPARGARRPSSGPASPSTPAP